MSGNYRVFDSLTVHFLFFKQLWKASSNEAEMVIYVPGHCQSTSTTGCLGVCVVLCVWCVFGVCVPAPVTPEMSTRRRSSAADSWNSA